MFHKMLVSIFLQLWIAAVAIAAPVAEESLTTTGNSVGYGTGGGIVGLIILVLDILVFIEVLKSNRPGSHKLLWCLVVFFFPLIGMLVYFLFSNREAHKTGGAYEPLP